MEESEFYLPAIMYDGIALEVLSLTADRYWLAAYSGSERVGHAGGESVGYLFAHTRIEIHRRAEPLFYTLPEEERLAVIRAVAPLRSLEPDRWAFAGAVPLDDVPNAFVVRANDDLGMVVTQTEQKNVEVADLFRESALEQMSPTAEGALS